MIYHTPTFETLSTAPVKQYDVVVARQVLSISGYADDTLKWTSSDLLMSVKIDSTGQMLGQTTKKCTVQLLGIQNNFSIGDIFQVRLGIFSSDPSVSGFVYISEGFFIVSTIDNDHDSGSTTVTLYDHMWEASKLKYADTVPSNAITYPISVQDFAEYIAGVLNTTLDPNFSLLPNASYMIPEDLYTTQSGTTIQNAIMDIAGATATTARISDTTLMFAPYNISDDNLDYDTLKRLTIGNTYGPVTSVVLGRTPQNDNIALRGTNPTNATISSVDTVANTLTATDSAMATGNMVYIESTGNLPSPLVAGVPYYVHMTSGDDVFKLSDTYIHAMAGTNFIDITSAGSGTISISHIDTKEIQINNNEILDDARQTLLPNIYNVLAGIDWSEVKAETVGLGWYEVGDVINFTQGTRTVRGFISEVHLSIAGSLKETLVSVVPDEATIDYKAAGSILKTLNNTEIKVDKQAQDITSIVSQQTSYEQTTQENFSEIYQNLTDILLTVQKSGGGNLISNSVGFATDSTLDGDSVQYQALSFWNYNAGYKVGTHGTASAYSSSESQSAGGVAGQIIELNGASISLEQQVSVAANTSLCFGARVKKALSSGAATITLYNDIDSFSITIDNATAYVWEELKLEDFVSRMSWLKIKIQASSVSHLQLTDLRLMYGTTLQGWVQSATEILATNVQFSKLGMKIFDNLHNTETQVTYNEFSTRRRSDNKVLFSADDTGIIANDISINGSTNYVDTTAKTVIKQITIPFSDSRAGVAFIKVA